ncbi:MAG TPA: hypothetical protein EYN38_08360, partial [Flavobacteriales bacterium]|nr:hypothetical protein [Flavobacteriales bacterium]
MVKLKEAGGGPPSRTRGAHREENHYYSDKPLRKSVATGVVQRVLNEQNIQKHYDLVQVNQGTDNVYVGTLKKGEASVKFPLKIVYKEGEGASQDRESNIRLMGEPGIFNVLGGKNNYFIMEAYDKKDAHAEWSSLKSNEIDIINQTINLAIHLLSRGIIDVDRGVEDSGGGVITMKNIVITGPGKPIVQFFDFEPRCLIDWKKLTYEDK